MVILQARSFFTHVYSSPVILMTTVGWISRADSIVNTPSTHFICFHTWQTTARQVWKLHDWFWFIASYIHWLREIERGKLYNILHQWSMFTYSANIVAIDSAIVLMACTPSLREIIEGTLLQKERGWITNCAVYLYCLKEKRAHSGINTTDLLEPLQLINTPRPPLLSGA